MPKTLLLADDSVVIQKLVGLSFANEAVELLTADNGDDAIALAMAHRPDAVIADVIMPGKSGYEVCEAIKQDPSLAHIPVLLLTGTFEAFDEERASAVGSSGHITKPFEAQALVARVNELFATPAPAAATAPAPAETKLEATPEPTTDSTSEGAFDFFEDDVSDLSSGVDPLSEPMISAPAEPLGRQDLDAGALGSDSTVALMPDDDAADALPASLVELDPEPAPASASADGSATVLAEDLFDAPAGDESDWLAAPDEMPPAAAETVVTDFEFPPEPIREAAFEIHAPAAASALADDDFAVPESGPLLEPDTSEQALVATMLADDLFDSPPPAVTAEPTVAAVQAEPDAAAVADEMWIEPTEVALEPDPSDFDIAPSEIADSVDANTPAPQPELPPATASAALSTPDLAPAIEPTADVVTEAIRERIHETLEKVAWEAFSELSEQVVRQVLERVETIAWEVIPQMTETMIREEIRRLKGEDEA